MIGLFIFIVDIVFFVFWLFALFGLLIPSLGEKYLSFYHKLRFKGLKNGISEK